MTKTQELKKVTSDLSRLTPDDRNYLRFLAQAMLLIQNPADSPVSAGPDTEGVPSGIAQPAQSPEGA